MKTYRSVILGFLISLVCIFYSSQSFAQNYGKIEGELGFGFGSSFIEDINPWIILALELTYNINSKYSIGLRSESAVTQKSNIYYPSYTAGTGSVILFGDYYFFNKNHNRFFTGIGFGHYDTGHQYKPYGFTPRLGFEGKHMRVIVYYNRVTVTGDPQPWQGSLAKYGGIALGYKLGGRYKGED